MKWFKHDTNAHTDAKLEKVLMKYGADGYALYWYCIELIAGKLDSQNFTFELEHDSELLGYKLKIDSLRIEEIMKYMISLGLFESSEDTITCLKLAKRLDTSMSGSPEVRKLIKNYHDNVMTCHDKVIAEENRTEEKRIEKIYTSERKRSNPAPIKKIIDLYHQLLPTLPKVAKLTKTREGYIKQRFIEDLPTLEHWENFFHFVSQSDFLMGRSQGGNGRRPFRADLEWLTKPANFAKISEDKYHG